MVNMTLFLLVIQFQPHLTVGVGVVEGFEERGWTGGYEMFIRYIVE